MNRLIAIIIALACLTSCEDDFSNVYSTKYPVRCRFTVVNHIELINSINNLGQFASIRMSGGKIVMTSSSSTTSYTPEYLAKEFYFGLGGIIVGTPTLPLDNQPLRAYDLACPNCDRAAHRLTLSDNGWATCSNCGIVYDLNSDGMIIDKGKSDFNSPRVLYRYRIIYDGNDIHVNNR